MKYGCHCDLAPDEEPDGCYLDTGEISDCIYAKKLYQENLKKENCEYWKPVKETQNYIYIRFTKPESYADISDALLFEDIVDALNRSADFSEFEPTLIIDKDSPGGLIF